MLLGEVLAQCGLANSNANAEIFPRGRTGIRLVVTHSHLLECCNRVEGDSDQTQGLQHWPIGINRKPPAMHYPVEDVDPVGFIEHLMESCGPTRKDRRSAAPTILLLANASCHSSAARLLVITVGNFS